MFNKSRLRYCQLSIILIALVTAWLIELIYALIPCPICWIQRFILIFLAMSLLIEFRYKQTILLSSLIYFLLLCGILLNMHHQYLINNYDPNASCLPGFDYLVNTFGVFKALHLIFTDHSSSCGNVVFSFLGLNIPQLLMIFYALLIAMNIFKQRLAS